ncbi:MAG: hypothetical protein A3J79_14630 [Elusimicrobia bacterium RIFOXYB2_FULL_62_6]|nr:MAG: hypothetical protein A3J79_14630 [Elusimicrobia bacterium RIFOXYB2_FULL_62_6]
MADGFNDRFSKILLALGAALAASAFFLPVINPDLFWHLSAGRFMFDHGAVPRADFLSWTMAGRPWFDFEWLAQLIYYWLFLKGGMTALYVFKAGLLLLTLVPFYQVIRLHKAEGSAFFLLPALAGALVTNSDLRPENFSVLFFAVVFWRLEAARLAPSFRAGAAGLALTLGLFAVWTNLHAGFLYGAALIGFYAAGDLFEGALPYIYGRRRDIPVGKWAQYLKFLAAALAASFINPYGWRLYEVIANHQRHIAVLQEYIQEWKPFDLTNIYQWPYIALLSLAFGRVLWRFLKTKAIVYEHLIALLFFAWSSSNHSRHAPFFSIAAAICLASVPVSAAARPLLRSALKLVLIAVFALYYKLFVWSQYSGPAWFGNCSESLVVFLNENAGRLSGLRLFNYWGWGGYLGFALSPDYKVFADGRYLFHEFLEEIMNSRNNPAAWQHFNAKYGFELMVLNRDQSRISVKHRFESGREAVALRPAYLFYLPKKDWAVVYWDAKVVVLVKRAAADPAWLAANEYKLLRPDDMENAAAAALEGELRMGELKAEAERFAARTAAGRPPAGCACGLEELFGPDVVKKQMSAWLGLLEKNCGEKGAKCRK